ncbi:2-oxoglutarate dehydrogenase, E2 component, dihydrolipoamide succinyltransferase [Micromonospora sp. NBC_01813]|uniref:2-oxoglutarate dehydrogenase, E2 component, dihydrolipoamide succinyltransferase n=1 Tax=Micromonospora sp. NBC_01813 TaxID=2975988 RepID=UPI002DDBA163|nr:2-oxoglutarate dehydrogenase, E2 component, dihydrolipoamide succinyltransferase [Micromonospora sp. NBC_01813]WSA09534.1 2-oxoglutarate dehydrogenase, E2 component, dihydrolipoamide succinyltransferase [Micromonospora sp. NBC_01813]
MPVSVTMPRLGESVTEGTVTRWLKQEGDRVEVDEPLLEVSTDKVDTEIPSPAAGVLSRIVVSEDETAEVGSELAVISGADEGGQDSSPEPAAQPQAATEQPAEPEPQPEPEPAAAPAAPPSGGAAPSGDATAVKMPALGESVTEGTVTRWLKQVGDSVEVDEPLLEVSTDKVDTEIPSPVAGTLLEIKVAEDDTADVGAELALIGSAGGAAPEPAQPEPVKPEPAQPEPVKPEPAKPEPAKPESAAAPAAPAERPAPAAAPAGASYASPAPAAETAAAPAQTERAAQPAAATASANGDGGYVTPLVRKLAAEQGVSLGDVRGTGVGGRIRKQDVLAAAEAARAAAEQAKSAPAAAAPAAKPQPSPLRGRTEKMTRTRTVIAKRMFESLQSSAQLTTVVEVDVTKIARLRAKVKGDFLAKHGVKLSFLPFFALAAVEALRTYPVVNASIDMQGGTITYPDGEHLGIAVDTDRGLLVPVISDAGDLNLAGLARRIADVAERTRTNKIGPDELSGATFTLTNTGSRGALFDTPIVPSPQAAILGTGAVVKRAAVVTDPELGEVIAPRSMVFLALSYDHRLVDGADAARFLTSVKDRLEAGAFEGELGLS